MKHFSIVLFVVWCILILQHTGYTQVNHTSDEIQTIIANTMWLSTGDTSTVTRDLGNGTSDQAWNFSDLNLHSSTVTIDTINYITPSGQLATDSFPHATLCQTMSMVRTLGGVYTMKMFYKIYNSIENDAVYTWGIVNHTQISPPMQGQPADTTTVTVYHPNMLALPLPLSASTGVRSQNDTAFFPGGMIIDTYTYTVSGSGMLTVPGKSAVEALRVIKQHWQVTKSGIHTGAKYEKNVEFYGEDLTQLSFSVDTGYTSGSGKLNSFTLNVKVGAAEGVSRTSDVVPDAFGLSQNYPNPFNPTTDFGFRMSEVGFVRLTVCDILGQEVATLVNEVKSPGEYRVGWNATGLSSGVYFYRLDAVSPSNPTKHFSRIRKMILAK